MKYRILLSLLISALMISACAPVAVDEVASVEIVEEPAVEMEEVSEVEEALPTEEVPEMSDGDMVSFSQDIWPVIEEFALSAHGGSGGVFLESYEDIMNYVEPGNPEDSMLYKALTGDGLKQMPPSGRLPDETIQLFYDWIKQGAPNN